MEYADAALTIACLAVVAYIAYDYSEKKKERKDRNAKQDGGTFEDSRPKPPSTEK